MRSDRLDPGAEALWVLQQLVPDRGVSNVSLAVELTGRVQWWPLREALNWLVRRHSALRYSFVVADGMPVRRSRPAAELKPEVDLLASDPAAIEADLTGFAARPFDLAAAPLVRVGAFTVAQQRSVICLVAHHIVIDAASIRLLIGELIEAYLSFAESGTEPRLPVPTAVPVRPASDVAVTYWRDHLAGFDPAGMALDGASTELLAEPTFAGDTLQQALSEEAMAALATLRRQCRATDATVLLAAYYLALRRHGAASDAVVGVMADVRGGAVANEVGYHVATMPVRVQVDDRLSIAELVGRVTNAVLAGYERGPVPFETLVGHDPAMGPGWWRSRLVRHLFNFRPSAPASAAGGFPVTNVSTRLSRFDLELTVEPVGRELLLKLLYSTEVHDRDFATAFLERLETLLIRAAADARRLVAEIDLLTGTDRAIIAASNDTARRWDGPQTVLGLVLRAAATAPDATAIVDDAGPVSYRQLLARAAAVRDQVRGVATTVGIRCARGASAAAAVLGVWAAGAAYVPLDPEHPAERLHYQIEDAGCGMVLDDENMPAATADTESLTDVDPERTAYLIYTSGSTGCPKGVRLTHTNLANVVRHFGSELGFGAGDAMLWLTTFAFDISALELCLPLAHGGRVVVASDAARAEPDKLLKLVDAEDIAVVQATPTTWRRVVEQVDDRLAGRRILCGGEPMPATLARRLLATGARVHNVYGPTETTIWSTAAELGGADTAVTVGRPIANTQAYVVDPRGATLPVGLSGELWLAGDGVAAGYHQGPRLTADRFGEHPEWGRYYRTGDLARWRPDGSLELLGRADRQVKLRGHRIELGEVESVLASHPEVTEAAVTIRGDASADGFLAAFTVCRAGAETELWEYAAARLPGYSVPARIVVVPRLPVTANGKVDQRALADWELTEPVPVPAEAADPVEADLVALWRELLGRHTLGAQANFFLNGGTSMLVVRLTGQATERCGVPVSMGMVFRAPTPAALAELIRADAS